MALGPGWESVTPGHMSFTNEGELRQGNGTDLQVDGDGILSVRLPPEIRPGRVGMTNPIMDGHPFFSLCDAGAAPCRATGDPACGFSSKGDHRDSHRAAWSKPAPGSTP